LRAKRAIGPTKLKILAIIRSCQDNGKPPHGYEIWKILQHAFHSYLEDRDLRNVYHHLDDLHELELISKTADEREGNLLPRQIYLLSHNGEQLQARYHRYLEICTRDLLVYPQLFGAQGLEE
jgi:DNA-binding PadR family transcriptional regulator